MAMRRSFTYKELLIVSGAAICCYLPFVNQALTIDSDMLVHTARQILVDPVNPPLGEYGRLMALHDHTRMPRESVYYRSGHPPLLAYVLAPVVAAAGEREWPLHLVMLIPYLLAVAGGWRLLGLFFEGKARLWGTLLWTTSPVLVVNSHTLMWDVTITALMLWSLVLFMEGLRRDSVRLLAAAGLVTGVAGLTKTNSIAVYALIGGYLLLSRRWKMLAAWAAPAVALPLIWVAHNLIVLGRIQYLSVGWLNLSPGNLRYRLERTVSYLGAATVVPVFWYWLAGVKRSSLLSLAPFAGLAAVWAALLTTVLGKPVWFSASYAVCAAAGGWVLCSCCLARLPGHPAGPVGRDRGLLAVYAILYFIVLLLLPSANARYIMPLTPAVVVLFVSGAMSLPPASRMWFRAMSVGSGALLAILLSIGDYLLCDADRRLPHLLADRGYTSERTWYFGRLAFAWYLHHDGYRNLRADRGTPRAGDFVVDGELPEGYPVTRYLTDDGWRLRPVDTLELYRYPVRTRGLHAGWYGESRLPFSVTPGHPLRRYVIYRIGEREPR